jgi:hypothetical protein
MGCPSAFKQMDKDSDGFVTLVAALADPCMDGSHNCHEEPEMTLLGGVFVQAQEPGTPRVGN